MNQHTETPWEADGTYLVARIDGRMVHIADFARWVSSSIPLGKANAAFAAKAVNHHDALVAALKECALEIAQIRNRKLTANEQYALDNARDILSRVEAAPVSP